MIVAVRPVGVADGVHAVLAAAVAAIGNAGALGTVRRGKREPAARGQKRLHPRGGQLLANTTVGCRSQESASPAGGADREGALSETGDDCEKESNAEIR